MTKVRNIAILAFLLLFKLTIVSVLVPQFQKAIGASNKINLIGFSDSYDKIAMNVINGSGYRFHPDTADTLMRPPVYVLALCGVFYLFGKSLLAVQFLHVLLGLATILVMRSLGAHLRLNTTTTLIAMSLFFFHPAVILAESRSGIESVFTFFLALFLFLLYRAIETSSRVYYAFAGSALGVSILIKSLCLFFPLFLLCYLPLRDGLARFWSGVANVLILILATATIISPWVIRNYRLTGDFVPTMTLAGTVAQEGLYVNKKFGTAKERYQLAKDAAKERNELAAQLGLSFRPRFLQYFYESKDEVLFDRYLFQKTIQEYKDDPSLFVQSAFMNFVRFWFQGRTWSATRLNVALTLPLLLLMLIGIYLKLFPQADTERATAKMFREASSKQSSASNLLSHEGQSGKYLAPLLLFIGYFVLVHLPFQGLARYHIPIIPYIALLAAIPLSAALHHAPLYWRLKDVFRMPMIQT